MIIRKEKLIPLFALILFAIGTSASAYVYAIQNDEKTVTINDQKYTIDQIFFIAKSCTIKTFDGKTFSGIALDDLIVKVGVNCPACHEYMLIGADKYQKTVSWEDMQNGLLTLDRMVAFSNLPKAYRIKNVVKIEVS